MERVRDRDIERKTVNMVRRMRGLRYCAHAGYGYRWCPTTEQRVPDEHEQRTMRHIAESLQGGLSWYGIARRLLYERVLTSDGREWSPARVRRAYLAYCSSTPQGRQD